MRFFTPGPTQLAAEVPALVQEALRSNVCSISHRSKDFEKIASRTVEALRSLLSLPSSHQIFFLGSATEAWERIIQNCSATHTFHLVNGSFSERFYTIAQELGRNAVAHEVPYGTAADLNTLTVPEEAELICLTHNETSTGVSLPESAVSALKKRYPDKLLAIDVVSSAPIVKLNWNDIDCGFFSVQKCFGMPAGLGVLIVSSAALAKAEALQKAGAVIGTYHSFPSLLGMAKKNQTPSTPNVLGIYLLGEVADSFLRRGIEIVRADTHRNAGLLYDFFAARPGYSLFVKEPQYRSVTVVTVEVEGGSKPLIERLLTKQIEVGAGYGKLKDSQIRIANFPMHTEDHVKALLSAIDS